MLEAVLYLHIEKFSVKAHVDTERKTRVNDKLDWLEYERGK